MGLKDQCKKNYNRIINFDHRGKFGIEWEEFAATIKASILLYLSCECKHTNR